MVLWQAKWTMPARKYMAVDVEPDRYGEIFDQVIHNTISEKGMRLAGQCVIIQSLRQEK